MATQVTHTPGPWTATGWQNLVVNAANGATLVAAPGGSAHAELAELCANAALIAAAPTMHRLIGLLIHQLVQHQPNGYTRAAELGLTAELTALQGVYALGNGSASQEVADKYLAPLRVA